MTPKKKKADLPQIPDDIKEMSFEEAYNALKSATELLENEEVNLDDTLAEYTRASALARHCSELLGEAEEKVKLLVESEGIISLSDLDEAELD